MKWSLPLLLMLSTLSVFGQLPNDTKQVVPRWYVSVQPFGIGTVKYKNYSGSQEENINRLLECSMQIQYRHPSNFHFGLGTGLLYSKQLDLRYHPQLYGMIGFSMQGKKTRWMPQVNVGIKKGLLDNLPHHYVGIGLCIGNSLDNNRFSVFVKPAIEFYGGTEKKVYYSSHLGGSHGSGPVIYDEYWHSYSGLSISASFGVIFNLSNK